MTVLIRRNRSTHNPPMSHGINVIMIFDLNMVVKKNESISSIGPYWTLTFGGTTQPIPNRRGATACVEELHFQFGLFICLIVGHPTMQQRPFVRVWMDIHKICSRGLTTFNRIETQNAFHPSTPQEMLLRTTSWGRFIIDVHVLYMYTSYIYMYKCIRYSQCIFGLSTTQNKTKGEVRLTQRQDATTCARLPAVSSSRYLPILQIEHIANRSLFDCAERGFSVKMWRVERGNPMIWRS